MFNLGKAHGQAKETMYDRIRVVDENPIEGQLSKLISNPPEGSVKAQITPKLAEIMLSYNTGNRPLSANTAKKYAREMRAGRWTYTRVPIIFSESGTLIDGQHRLHAVVLSGTPILSDVAFGAPEEAFAFIDMGKKRGASDIFAIEGVKDYTTVSAAIGWVYQYETNRMMAHGSQISPSELYEVYLKHQGVHESLPFGKKFKKSKVASASLMTAMHYLCAQKSRRDADDFFTIAGDGFGAQKKFDPALTLRNKLIDAVTNGEKLHRSIIAGLTINAWNLRRMDRSGRGLRFDPMAAFPRVR